MPRPTNMRGAAASWSRLPVAKPWRAVHWSGKHYMDVLRAVATTKEMGCGVIE